MTIAEARQTFARLMQTAQTRPLSVTEKKQLSYARQQLRMDRRGGRRNPKKAPATGAGNFVVTNFLPRGEHTGTYLLLIRNAAGNVHIFGLSANDAKRAQLDGARHVSVAEARRIIGSARRSGSNPRKRQAKRNPATKRTPGGYTYMGRLVEIRYNRDHGRSPGFYRHTFTARPKVYYRASDNSIKVKG